MLALTAPFPLPVFPLLLLHHGLFGACEFGDCPGSSDVSKSCNPQIPMFDGAEPCCQLPLVLAGVPGYHQNLRDPRHPRKLPSDRPGPVRPVAVPWLAVDSWVQWRCQYSFALPAARTLTLQPVVNVQWHLLCGSQDRQGPFCPIVRDAASQVNMNLAGLFLLDACGGFAHDFLGSLV